MRILLLTTGLRLGGAERQVVDLATAFVARGHDVAIMSLTPEHDIAIPDTVQVVRLDMAKTPVSLARTLRKARRWLSAWQPAVIHAHMFHANIFARMLGARDSAGHRVPLICTAHSLREGGFARMLAYRLTDRACTLTTHVSAEGRQAMIDRRAVPAHRIRVMPNGIDLHRFHPDAERRRIMRERLACGPDTRLVLNVGRLVPEKAQHHLIAAFAALEKMKQEVSAGMLPHLLVAGDGPLRAALQAQIDALGLESKATLLGARADVPDLMNAADLFVLSSSLEGLPLVVAEAMACGLPVVATDVPGIRALVGESAGIVPAGNVDKLTAAMRRALAVPPDTQDSRAHIEAHFSLEQVAAQWLALYGECTRAVAGPDHA